MIKAKVEECNSYYSQGEFTLYSTKTNDIIPLSPLSLLLSHKTEILLSRNLLSFICQTQISILSLSYIS